MLISFSLQHRIRSGLQAAAGLWDKLDNSDDLDGDHQVAGRSQRMDARLIAACPWSVNHHAVRGADPPLPSQEH
jgi:hypothetical protein